MKIIKFLVTTLVMALLISCNKDDDQIREELPGIPTTISGNVKDYHRNINVANFEIKLIKVWSCPDGGIGPNYCTKLISTIYSDNNGNYFTFYDNASGSSSLGASPSNKLYYNSTTGTISGTSATPYASGLTYTITQIRKSKLK